MKKIAALAMMLALILTLAACTQKPDPEIQPLDGQNGTATTDILEQILSSGELVVGISPDYAPCEFLDPTKNGDEAVVGSDVEFAKYVAQALGVELVIKQMDFDSIQAAVQTGKVDIGISGFSYTPERAEVVYLTDKYNMNEFGQGLLVPAGQEGNYTAAEDFAGKKIAVQNGSLQLSLAEAQLPDDVELVLVTNINDAVMMLLTGKVDAIGVSGENGLALAQANDGIAMCEFEYVIEDEGYVCMIQMGQDALLAKVNEIIADVVEQELYAQWMADAQALQASLGVE